MPTVNETRGKLIGFAFLPEGWHFKKGVPAKEQSLKIAFAILDEMESAGFACTDAFPGVDGSVMVSAYDLPDLFDFDVKPSGLVTVSHERGEEDIYYQEGMSVEEARAKIKEFGSSTCHTPDYLILGATTAGNAADLSATPSRTQKTVQASQLSKPTARDVNPGVYVNMLPGSTPRSRESRRSFGRFRVKLSRTVGV